MSDDTAKSASKTLNDSDIATYARRAGPDGAGAHDDVDSHSDSDTHVTDHDTAPAAQTDGDAPTDKDS